jgi:hypothetical protein
VHPFLTFDALSILLLFVGGVLVEWVEVDGSILSIVLKKLDFNYNKNKERRF